MAAEESGDEQEGYYSAEDGEDKVGAAKSGDGKLDDGKKPDPLSVEEWKVFTNYTYSESGNVKGVFV